MPYYLGLTAYDLFKIIMKKYKKPFQFLLVVAIIGQFMFAIVSPKYTTPRYENKIFTTMGAVYDNDDLHRLNEAAHYFGQTIVGWSKFPNFRSDLIDYAELPSDSGINMHVQERMNFVFTISTNEAIESNQLVDTKDFLQSKLDEYNSNTNTNFILSNIDYEQAEISRSYAFGALVTLLLSVIIGLGLLFVRKEFFPPKLKL